MDLTDERTEERNLIKLGMYIVSGTVLGIFILFSGCTMHSDTYTVERAKGEAVKIRAQAELEKAESRIEELRLETLESLISKGVNPISARCAVKGWKKESEGQICERASQKSSN